MEEFIRMIARLNTCGDEIDCVPWEHDTGDGLDTLDSLITKAREIVATADNATPDRPIVVILEGGMVQSVVTHGALVGVPVTVIDYDTDGADETELSKVKQADGRPVDAFVRAGMVVCKAEIDGEGI